MKQKIIDELGYFAEYVEDQAGIKGDAIWDTDFKAQELAERIEKLIQKGIAYGLGYMAGKHTLTLSDLEMREVIQKGMNLLFDKDEQSRDDLSPVVDKFEDTEKIKNVKLKT